MRCWECRDHSVEMNTHLFFRGLFVYMRWHAVLLEAETDSIPSPKSVYITLPIFPLFYRPLNVSYSNSIIFFHPSLPFHYFPLIFRSNFCSNSFPPILFSQKSQKLTSENPDYVPPFFLAHPFSRFRSVGYTHSLYDHQIHLIHAVLSLILFGWGRSSALRLKAVML